MNYDENEESFEATRFANSSRAGYVYVLTNASMPGLVKIGRTDGDPTNRARELSSDTGVPTPFVVVYQRLFRDCVNAEASLHILLERNGSRVSANREFFSAPIHQVVALVAELEDPDSPTSASERYPGRDSARETAITALLHEALDEALGLTPDGIADPSRAASLYQQAARLGSAEAHWELGLCYLRGNGVPRSVSKEIYHFREAGRLGRWTVYPSLAFAYLEHPELEEPDRLNNANACWSNFFEALGASEDSIVDHEDQASDYIDFAMAFGIHASHAAALAPVRERLIASTRIDIQKHRTDPANRAAAKARLRFIRQFVPRPLPPPRYGPRVVGYGRFVEPKHPPGTWKGYWERVWLKFTGRRYGA